METELVPLPGSTVSITEPLTPLLDCGLVLATGTLCNGERLCLDKRDETQPPPAALRTRPRDRVLLPRDSCTTLGEGMGMGQALAWLKDEGWRRKKQCV
uniref:Uncharacterized protein n=1 Tax=Anabas testudineus TaxID=64144 RepID=A0A7N6AKJ0_ANATE